MIPQGTVDRILDTARVEEVIGDFVTLKRRGASMVACCPFHNEKTPSFYVTPSKGIYKCFGCGKAGTAVGFVMEYEHVSFVEAVRYLANKYHIEIEETEESADEIVARQKRESLFLVMDFAQDFFVKQLSTPEGRNLAMAYYKSRGLGEEAIGHFGLGWAPSSRTALRDAALAAGYKEEYLLDAGLCIRRDDGTVLDKFHARVTFPVRSVSGRVIAFSCRTLSADANIPKYINSPDTELYDKSRSLFGIYLAKSDISRMDKCYLVEGNLDVVSMHQMGITNLVASCGTSLTLEQVRLIKRFTDNVTIMYDGDKAGIHAAVKAIDLILGEGMNAKVVLFPDGDDPDSFSRKHSLQEVEDFIATHEQDFVDFKSKMLLDQAGGDPLRKAELINDIADTVALIPDAIKRSVYVETVSGRFGIESGILFERIRKVREKRIADEEAAREREARRRENAVPPEELPIDDGELQPWTPEMEDVQQTVTADSNLTMSALETDKTVAPFERQIVQFLILNGTDPLDFESDSEYYSGDGEDKVTVADFIVASIGGDADALIVPAYAKAYGTYLDYYYGGLSQDAIQRSMLNSPDREIAFVSSQLYTEKYQLTVANFRESMTTTSSWLVNFVPRTILKYMISKIDRRMKEIQRELGDSDSVDALLEEICTLQRNKQSLQAKLKNK